MPDTRLPSPRPPRQLPWPLLVAIDVALIGLGLVIFALFDHVIPSKGVVAVDRTYAPAAASTSTPAPTNAPTDVPAAETAQNPGGVETTNAALPAETPSITPDPTTEPTPEPTPTPDISAMGDFSEKFQGLFTDGDVIQTANTYVSRDLNVTVSRYDVELGGSPQVYYVEDIYIRKIDCFRNVFAFDKYGRSITEDVLSMSQRTNAVAGINGDFYAVGTAGIVIRNGVLYRDQFETGEEVLVIFRDGNMKVYHHIADLDLDEAMAQGAWQAYSFGPGLFDEEGGIQVTVHKGLYRDPRTVIGMVEPGHYIFMVADGRQSGYSEGMTYDELSEIMSSLGCTVAYNLDGGRTSQMTFMGAFVNQPVGGGRTTSELIYVTDWDEE